MKKIILTLILCLAVCGPAFAQSDMQMMRFLTINALMQYGQKLYDRGDYNEASSVFNHVLTYDSHQPQALEYLKDMGVKGTVPQPQVVQAPVAVPDKIVVEKSDIQIMKTIDVLDTDSLKKAIEIKKQIIEKLRAQIMRMRANIASQM